MDANEEWWRVEVESRQLASLLPLSGSFSGSTVLLVVVAYITQCYGYQHSCSLVAAVVAASVRLAPLPRHLKLLTTHDGVNILHCCCCCCICCCCPLSVLLPLLFVVVVVVVAVASCHP